MQFKERSRRFSYVRVFLCESSDNVMRFAAFLPQCLLTAGGRRVAALQTAPTRQNDGKTDVSGSQNDATGRDAQDLLGVACSSEIGVARLKCFRLLKSMGKQASQSERVRCRFGSRCGGVVSAALQRRDEATDGDEEERGEFDRRPHCRCMQRGT